MSDSLSKAQEKQRFLKKMRSSFRSTSRPRAFQVRTIMVTLLLLTFLPLGVLLVNQQTDTRQHAAGSCITTAIATGPNTINFTSPSGTIVEYYLFTTYDPGTQTWTNFKDIGSNATYSSTADLQENQSYQVQAIIKTSASDTGTLCTAGFVTVRDPAKYGETINTLPYFFPSTNTDKAVGSVSRLADGNKYYYTYAPKEFDAYELSGDTIYWRENHSETLTTNIHDPHNFTLADGKWLKTAMRVGEPFQAARFVNITYNNASCQAASVTPNPYPLFSYDVTIEGKQTIDAGPLGSQEVIVVKYDYFGDYEKFYYSKDYGWIKWERYHRGETTPYKHTEYFSSGLKSAITPTCSVACANTFATCTLPPTPTETGIPTATGTPPVTVTPTAVPDTPTPTGTSTPTPIISSCPSNTYTAVLMPNDGISSNARGNVSLKLTGSGNLGYDFNWETSLAPLPQSDFKGIFLQFTGTMSGSSIGIFMDSAYTGSQHASYYMTEGMLHAMQNGTMYAVLKTSAHPDGELTGPVTCQDTLPATSIPLKLFLHGIGTAGDNANPFGKGNTNPKTPKRGVIVEALQENQAVATGSGTVQYDNTTGSFAGTVPLTVPAGSYRFRIKIPGYLPNGSNPILVATGKAVTLTSMYLVNGDINDDNTLDILDYNAILSCMDPAVSCTADQQKRADLDDNGTVELPDYNLFLREIAATK